MSSLYKLFAIHTHGHLDLLQSLHRNEQSHGIASAGLIKPNPKAAPHDESIKLRLTLLILRRNYLIGKNRIILQEDEAFFLEFKRQTLGLIILTIRILTIDHYVPVSIEPNSKADRSASPGRLDFTRETPSECCPPFALS